ncbi:MAG: replication endonuclease [Comamonas sp.]
MTLATTNAAASHCLFVTLTVPSRMHAMRMKLDGQQPNPVYDGSTPRDAQAQLRKTWACIRASFKRYGAECWGMRVTEPQHDGTPHWHALMWVEAAHMQLADAMRVCKVSSTSCGVCVMAVTNESLGYIGKYLAKCAEPDDARVRVWASAWGFRLSGRFGIWPAGGAA